MQFYIPVDVEYHSDFEPRLLLALLPRHLRRLVLHHSQPLVQERLVLVGLVHVDVVEEINNHDNV